MSDLKPKLSATGKTLAVLEALIVETRLSDIATRAGLGTSTTHRILSELVEAGWATHDPAERRYTPGRRMHAAAGALHDDSHVVGTAMPCLEHLRALTGFTIHMGLQKGDEIMYAAKLNGTGSYRMISRVGGLVPMHSTAIGKAVLSTWPDEQVVALVERHGLKAVTPNSHQSAASLLQDLEATRRRGWALDAGENEPILRCIGAPIIAATGKAIGGVSVSALHFELPDDSFDRVAAAVRSSARRISEALGAPKGR